MDSKRNWQSWTLAVVLAVSCYGVNSRADEHEVDEEFFAEFNAWVMGMTEPLACDQPTAEQRAMINEGNKKRDLFISRCLEQTGGSSWCHQLIRPNPDSISTFRCTYGANQPHQLIHPNESTWSNAFQAVNLVRRLQSKGVKVCVIYNWWRPEPYNSNVGGSKIRHPYGTSVDVRFCDKANQNKAFTELCRLRRLGQLKAIGYYPGTGLHFGVNDSLENTWGKTCP